MYSLFIKISISYLFQFWESPIWAIWYPMKYFSLMIVTQQFHDLSVCSWSIGLDFLQVETRGAVLYSIGQILQPSFYPWFSTYMFLRIGFWESWNTFGIAEISDIWANCFLKTSKAVLMHLPLFVLVCTSYLYKLPFARGTAFYVDVGA